MKQLICLLLAALFALPAYGQDARSIDAMLQRLDALQAELDAIDQRPETSLTVVRERREAEARDVQAEIDRVVEEIHLALSGVEDGAFAAVFESPPTDLQTELQEFFEPFLVMLRSATERSREIEEIRRELSGLEEQLAMTEGALERLGETTPSAEDSETLSEESAELKALWSRRLESTTARKATLEAKLQAIRSGNDDAAKRAAAPATFLRDRGITLLLGLLAGAVTWIVLSFVGSLVNRASRNRKLAELGSQGLSTTGLDRSIAERGLGVPVRAARLFYRFFTIAAAIVAALTVFNSRNDWLLLGFGVLLLLGFLWTLIKSLPEFVEQMRTLLNLGSVQEGERLIFDGVPWRVSVLDFHSVLENPALEGGNLSLPVRDLAGHYSRPIAPSEGWFPTNKGDWVLLDDDKIAEVLVQTPGYVTLRRLGGGTVMVPTAGFVEEPPMNLSNGFRVELEFGLDYGLQAESTTTIVDTMRTWLEERLPSFLPEGSIQNLEVEFFAAADSSLNYEIEVDLAGFAACEYEEVGRILSRLLVDCCNEHGWGIPFPQVQVHGVS
ncbi:MAG: hypothetical protein AAF690_27205 [Acidobacteriota bacterium]